ncbi:MAG: diguanylate cyclase [Sulfolobaceae archaeon]|nr:diguanylate cyclase [Sulfolobaceae archaeon]
MKVAIASTNGMVSGPGEAEEVHIYEINGSDIKLLDSYENPAKYKEYARGVYMLRSVMDKEVDAVVLSEIGGPGFRYVAGKIKVYIFEGSENEALKKLMNNELVEAKAPTHEHGHHHHLEI